MSARAASRHRYQTARAMLADLENPSAAPSPAVRPPRRRVKSLIRHAAYPVTIAAVLTGLSLLVALSR